MCLDVHRKYICGFVLRTSAILKRSFNRGFRSFLCISAKIPSMLSIENADFIRIFLLYTQKRNDGQNLVPKMEIYLNISAELKSH